MAFELGVVFDDPMVALQSTTLAILVAPLDVNAEVERLTNKLGSAIAAAFKERGATPFIQPPLHEVDLNYEFPDTDGRTRQFRFAIELQVNQYKSAEGALINAVVPRIFAEAVRVENGVTYTQKESNDQFARLVGEIQKIISGISEIKP